jgi:hypothetical protein
MPRRIAAESRSFQRAHGLAIRFQLGPRIRVYSRDSRATRFEVSGRIEKLTLSATIKPSPSWASWADSVCDLWPVIGFRPLSPLRPNA